MTGSFSGILSPVDWTGGSGVTAQFIEDAEKYHSHYFDISYATYQLSVALDVMDAGFEPQLILDVGSGSGTSVIALLERFSSAHVICTDVSPQLLSICMREVERRGLGGRCTYLCIDLNHEVFIGRNFDLVIGSAILHHLFEPEKLIKSCLAATKINGAASFFEPFEVGYVMLGVIYRLLLSYTNFDNFLPEKIENFFRDKVKSYLLMKCEPKDYLTYENIDDKWMFTQDYFRGIACRLGSRLEMSVLNSSPSPWTDQVRTDLRLGLGLDPSDLPDWAWSVISAIEADISQSAKEDMAVARVVTFFPNLEI